MPAKLGAHILNPTNDGVRLVSAGSPLVKLVDHFDIVPQLLAIKPDLLVIGRIYEAHQNLYQGSPEQSARDWVARQAAQYDRYPLIRVWEGPNEPSFGAYTDSREIANMQWYAAFEAERVRQLAARGLRAVIANFSTGNPFTPDVRYSNANSPEWAFWLAFLPALQVAAQYNGILGLHEYSAPWMWWLTGAYQPNADNLGEHGWLTLRYRAIYQQFLVARGLGGLPLVLTEVGLDNVGSSLLKPGMPSGPWKQISGYWQSQNGQADPIAYWRNGGRDEHTYYAEQLIWYDQQLQRDSYVLGATIFTVGWTDSKWDSYDINNTRVVDRLESYLRSQAVAVCTNAAELVGSSTLGFRLSGDTGTLSGAKGGRLGALTAQLPVPLQNTDFSAGTHRMPEQPHWQIPLHWQLVVPAKTDSVPFSSTVLRRLDLAWGERQQPFLPNEFCWRIAAMPASAGSDVIGVLRARLTQTVRLSPGDYHLQVWLYPDLALGYRDGKPILPVDPLSAQALLRANQEQTDWQPLPIGELTALSLKFQATDQPFNVVIDLFAGSNSQQWVTQQWFIAGCSLTPLWGARSAGVSKIMSSNSAVGTLSAPALGGSSDKGITLTSDQAATAAGQVFQRVFSFRNTGTCTWQAGYGLSQISGTNMGITRQALTETPPGQTASISLNLTAPAQSGSFQSIWQLQAPNGSFFGPTAIVNVTVSSAPVTGDDASLITDVPIIDANNVPPGSLFSKIWQLKNTGSVAWDGQVELAYQSGHAFAKLTAIAVTGVPQTQTTQVKLSLVAPTTPGNYTAIWQMRRKLADGQRAWFGPTLNVSIQVNQQLKVVFVQDLTLPDGSTLLIGQTSSKVWRLKNESAVPLPDGVLVRYLRGDQLASTNAIAVPVVPAAAEFDVTLPITGRLPEKQYVGVWQLHLPDGVSGSLGIPIGPQMYFKVVTKVPVASDSYIISVISDMQTPNGTLFFPNTPFGKTWRLRNVGTAWGNGFKLVQGNGTTLSAETQISLPPTAAQADIDVSLLMRAPATPNYYPTSWRLVGPNGENGTGEVRCDIQVIDPGESVYDVRYVRDVTIPDNTVVQTGQKIIKTWRIRNNGTVTIPRLCQLRYVYGTEYGGSTQVYLPNDLESGKTVDLTVELFAPRTSGKAQGYWQLYDLKGVRFGPMLWVLTQVQTVLGTLGNDIGGGGSGLPALRPTDGFWYPVGNRTDLQGWIDAQPFLRDFRKTGEYHPGADLNLPGTPDHDLGQPVYSVANGQVVFAASRPVWGNIVLIEHLLASGELVWSQYAHLQQIDVQVGQRVLRGETIGRIGQGEKQQLSAHLHFEIRKKSLPANSWVVRDAQVVRDNYHDPLPFIARNLYRPPQPISLQLGLSTPDGESGLNYLLQRSAIRPQPTLALSTVALGTNPTVLDYRRFERAGIRVLVQLTFGYPPHGCLPHPQAGRDIERFVQAAIRTMQTSQGVAGYILGEQPNNPAYTPEHVVLGPSYYALLYNRIWQAKPSAAKLAPAAVEPYGGPNLDARDWWVRMLAILTGADFLVVQAQTSDCNPEQVASAERLPEPRQWQFAQFRAYQPLLLAVPAALQKLPVYAVAVQPRMGWVAGQATAWGQRVLAHVGQWNLIPAVPRIQGVVWGGLGGTTADLLQHSESLQAWGL